MTRDEFDRWWNSLSLRERDVAVAEKIFGAKGVGYYGPTKSHGFHQDYRLCATKEEALALYVEHWKGGSGRACGADMALDDIDVLQWRDSWGPVIINDYSTDIGEAWELAERFRLAVLPVDGDRWVATPIGKYGPANFVIEADLSVGGGSSDREPSWPTAAEAICYAATMLACCHPQESETTP